MCGRRFGRRETSEGQETGWAGRPAPTQVRKFPFLPCRLSLSLQLAGLFSCMVVLAVLLWLGPFFYYLPKVGRKRDTVCLSGTG